MIDEVKIISPPNINFEIDPSYKRLVIEVEVKQRYGKPRFYPISDQAKFLTDLIGKPTLTTEHLAKCKAAGYEVNIHAPSYKLEDFVK